MSSQSPLSRAYVIWSESYSVGHPLINLEHKSLLDIINLVYIMLSAPPNPLVLAYVLDRLVEYTNQHFHDEEKLLLEAKYPEFESHRALHLAMISKTAQLREQLLAAPAVDHAQDLLIFLKNWWINHISKADKKYEPYVQEQRS